MNKLWIAIGCGLLLTAASLLLWQRPLAKAFARPSSAVSLSADVADLRTEVAALRDRDRNSVPVIVKYETSERAEAPVSSGTPPRPELSMDEKIARMEEHSQEMAVALDQRLLTEGRDPVWSNESLSQLDASLKARVPGSTLLESSCSANVCRATLRHTSELEQRGLGNAIAQSPPFDQGTFYRYDRSSNPPKTTLYVIRSGHDLKELTGVEAPDLGR